MVSADILRPMLASLVDAPLADAGLVYEPKYDGIRAVVEIEPGRGARAGQVHLWSRLGNEKTSQFPDAAAAIAGWSRRLKAPLVVDGEIVAIDAKGRLEGFEQLQSRMDTGKPGARMATAFVVFDLLKEGPTDWRKRPLLERRARLEALFASSDSPLLRISEQVKGDGRALYRHALEQGWEGLIVKGAASAYHSGKRTTDWRKMKIVREQEFVIGGWTEPRHTRSHFGALLLGVYEAGGATGPARGRPRASRARNASGTLVYVGSVGTGFDEKALTRIMKALGPIETPRCPFRDPPKTPERPHWVEPTLVAQVRFMEWTSAGRLRHPVYLGLRDDTNPRHVVREPEARVAPLAATRVQVEDRVAEAPKARAKTAKKKSPDQADDTAGLVAQLQDLEDRQKDGVLELPGRGRLAVTNLHKVFWPKQKLTKGDLFRYYAAVAPCILPVVADRPLVMKRFPNGITGEPFYQHRAADAPAGVRIEPVSRSDRRPQFVGGSLATLLYMTQLAAISQDPWFSTVQTPQCPDYVALDLDPPDGAPFGQVLDVARWVRDELDGLGAAGFPKTSGATGLHVYLPLPPDTPYEAGQLLCQIIATMVAHKHPKHATIERSVAARGNRVYVDFLQNAHGKTLATAYSARASEYAGVSAPLTWKEVDGRLRREDFTITSMPARIKEVGDLWAKLRTAKGVDLARIARATA